MQVGNDNGVGVKKSVHLDGADALRGPMVPQLIPLADGKMSDLSNMSGAKYELNAGDIVTIMGKEYVVGLPPINATNLSAPAGNDIQPMPGVVTQSPAPPRPLLAQAIAHPNAGAALQARSPACD